MRKELRRYFFADKTVLDTEYMDAATLRNAEAMHGNLLYVKKWDERGKVWQYIAAISPGPGGAYEY